MGKQFTINGVYQDVYQPIYSAGRFLKTGEPVSENHAQIAALALCLATLPSDYRGLLLTGSMEVLYLMKRSHVRQLRGVPEDLMAFVHEEKQRVCGVGMDTIHVKLPRQDTPLTGSLAKAFEQAQSGAKGCVVDYLLRQEFEAIYEAGGTLDEIDYLDKTPNYELWCCNYGIERDRLRI